MEEKPKKYLNIENCITLHDVKQIQKEPAGKKIKTINALTKLLIKKGLKRSETAIYSKLQRYQDNGFTAEDVELTKALLKVLEVTKTDLIKPLL